MASDRLLSAGSFKPRWREEETRKVPGLSTNCGGFSPWGGGLGEACGDELESP